MDELILRSAYLRQSDDLQLRNLAHELNVSKSDLMRAAIHLKLEDWRLVNDADVIRRDLAFRSSDSDTSETLVLRVKKPTKARHRDEPQDQQQKAADQESGSRGARPRAAKAQPAMVG